MERISVLMAVDDHFVAPLLTTVASLFETLRPDVRVDLHVMECALQPEARGRIVNALGESVRLRWTAVDERKAAALCRTGRPVSSYRTLAGSSLPSDVRKVIYLDADLLVRRDIFELWERDMRGNIVLAVQDSFIQRPAGWLEGATSERPYFNSGVMMMDLDAWRASAVEQRCLEAATRFAHPTRWHDQDVLNLCLAGRWGELEPVWNKQFSLDLFPDWRCSPYPERDFHEARANPAIIHFCSRAKPWHSFCDHRPEDVLAYRDLLLRIAPWTHENAKPSPARRTLEWFAAPHRRVLDKTAAACRARRRTHALRAMFPEVARLVICHPWTGLSVPLSVICERTASWFGGLLRRHRRMLA